MTLTPDEQAALDSLTTPRRRDPMTIPQERREELRDLAAELDDDPILGGLSMAGDAIRELLTALDLAEEWADEQSHPLVMRQGEILTSVALALNGPHPPLMSWSHHDLAGKAARAVSDRDAAEARIRDLTQEVRDERAACLDQIEQVAIRDARIKAVQDVHRHITVETRGATEPKHRCRDCCLSWPCPTIRALEGQS